MARSLDKKVEAFQSDVDPDGSHGSRKVLAALKWVGIEVDDLDPGFQDKGPGLHEKVPQDRRADIADQRKQIREGLRQQRLQQVREALQLMDDDTVRRLETWKGGVNPVTDKDLPPVEKIDGVSAIMDKMEQNLAAVRRQQERQANAICTEFLLNKQRADDADAQIKALNDRLAAAKKEQENEWKAKRTALQKAEENRKAKVSKAKQERDEYENEVLAKSEARLAKARATRAHTYSTANLKVKADAVNAKREAAYWAAIEQEEQTLAEMEARQNATEERLMRDRLALADRLEKRRQDRQKAFDEKQIEVCLMHEEWAENKAKQHEDFMKHFNAARDAQRNHMKDRSKSAADIHKKATDKWKSNHDRLMQEKGANDADLMAKLRAAEEKVENELKPMKLKCGGDVFSHLEVKDKTFGDLVARRKLELQRAQDARTQALLLKVAERKARDDAKESSYQEVHKKRVEAAKDLLRYSNEASAIFLKIKSEPNEDRIRTAMGTLGFKMPKVGGKGEEEPAESS